MVCAARVPPGITNPKFSWMRIPSNTTVAKEYHDDIRSKSHLTITTYKGQDFEALQCRAETKATVKFHIVNITKLSKCKVKSMLTLVKKNKGTILHHVCVMLHQRKLDSHISFIFHSFVHHSFRWKSY